VLLAVLPVEPVAEALGVEMIEMDAVGWTSTEEDAAEEAVATADELSPQVAAETLPRREEMLASPPVWAPEKTEEMVADWSALPVEV
jgi:hypothetical protein